MKRHKISSALQLAPAAALTASSASAAPAMPRIDFVDPMGSAFTQGHDLSPVGMFMAADVVVQAVIISLLVASVITWTIGLMKWAELKGQRRRLQAAMRKLIAAPDIASIGDTGFGPVSDMIVSAEDEIAASGRSGVSTPGEGVKDRIALRLDRLHAAVRRHAGRGVGILAIVGSSAPFVGLFGTVWGIMNAFIGIAQSQTTNLAVVAPGIAEALLTTAIGLVAAIPAGIMYNVFARALATYVGEVGDASAAVLCLAAREIDRTQDKG
ncbi:tonB-system energizer ExbB [Brevundimonas sp.]|uniref:tonB-system energizer ExbB n=1 Tax=Brevundimonas sp. TaxID=1871086 RepID=UPI003D129344